MDKKKSYDKKHDNSKASNQPQNASANTQTQPAQSQQAQQGNLPQGNQSPEQLLAKLPKETQEKLMVIKEKIEKFQKIILEKFDKYIMGISLLPPPKTDKPEEEKDKIHILVLVDDSDSKKMSKFELRDKLIKIMEETAKDIDKNIIPQTLIISELWQNIYDAKYELLQLISVSAPVFDNGMLSAIKIAEIHKVMVLKKFEKYIVSYVLAGSLVQGRATKTSDIDVWIVIDDTDVKKMTRAELKDKLRAIIIGMGIEAGEITGIRNKLNIQVYILTEFWDSLREANPIIFTLLRDGVPFYDRGIFMPWKQLLRMGKIKPSPEAIDMFMSTGEQMLKRVQAKIREIGMEDIYYAILTPSQAALMLYGIPPPAPKETAEVMRDVFIKKESLMEEKFIKILEDAVQLRKDLEHGTKKEVSGKELDEALDNADKYLKRLKKLCSQIERIKEENDMVHIYETIITALRDVLKLEGREKVSDVELIKVFEDDLISTGKVPAKYLRILNDVVDAKKDYDEKKLTKQEIEKVRQGANDLTKFLIEYIQRKRGRDIERAKIRVKYGNKFGEVILLDTYAYITLDIDAEQREVSKAKIRADGGIGPAEKCTADEFEHALANAQIPQKVFIKEPVFEDLKKLFGKDIEILMNY